jgi:carboxylesterase type B
MNTILNVVFFISFGLAFVFGQIQQNETLPGRIIRPGRIVTLLDGVVQGSEETYGSNRKIYTFKGIPYAKPPLGDLRFSPPVPVDPWNGTLKADSFGPCCPQMENNFFFGDEDCLYINVHTPEHIRSFLPVVVYIHGGGFYMGNGNTDLIGPEPIIEDDVIVVTLNYRLGPLGFLSTCDSFYTGNYGLRDIILGLKWVKRNIRFFGGNSDEVTIMGVSAGGAAVHALVLSPAAEGLFHRAISQSGSLFNPWAFNYNPYKTVLDLANKLELDTSNKTNLLIKLKEVSTERLIRAANVVGVLGPIVEVASGTFVPTMDDFAMNRVLPDIPSNLLKMGYINRVPFIMGFNSMEMLHSWPQILYDKIALERFTQNQDLLLLEDWTFPDRKSKDEVIQQILDLYFGGKLNSTWDFGYQFANYISDRSFVFGISKMFMLHSELQDVYYYKFSYNGSFNYMKIMAGLQGLPGAAHGDDMFYLFRNNGWFPSAHDSENNEAYKIMERNTRLWSNFMKTGNPTPFVGIDPLITSKWTKANSFIQNYMDIDSEILLRARPFSNRLDVLHRLDKIYGIN